MATEAPAKPKRETWQDWLPPGVPAFTPDELMPRAEFLTELRNRGIDASESDLRYWEYVGALPRPIRRWHEGATRALYPRVAFDAVSTLRRLQRDGLPLEDIGARLRERTRFVFAFALADPGDLDSFLSLLPDDDDRCITPTLVAELERLARQREQRTGVATDHIEIGVVDTNGRRTTYRVPIAPTESA